MAIDTKQKRFSIYGYGFLGMPATFPEGAIDEDQRRSIGGVIPGLISAEPIRIRFISPNRGSVSGGTLIDITLKNAGDIEGEVEIGGNAATIAYWSDSLVQALSPAGTRGYADVYIKSATTQDDTLDNGFLYIPDVTTNRNRRIIRVKKGHRRVSI